MATIQDKIKRFLNAHPQHEIQVTLRSQENHNPVTIHLGNGECWMGLDIHGRVDELPGMFEEILNEYAEIRPDHMANQTNGNT